MSAHTEEKAAPAPEAPEAARKDAQNLHRAFEGKGCDKSTTVHILANRNEERRALIRQEYNTLYSEDLDNALSNELSGNLKEAVSLWMHERANRDAILVKQGFTGELKIAIDVICSRAPLEIQSLKKAYRAMYGFELDQDIEKHASHYHKKLLLNYLGTQRSNQDPKEVDKEKVEKDAKVLYDAGENRWGTDEDTFIRIFTERSSAHLAAINSAYHKLYGNSLKKAVKNETSGKFERGLLTIILRADNPGKYFAKALHKGMNRKSKVGIDAKKLTRIIVSRAEIDIDQVKAEYNKKYRKSLSDEVHSKTTGHYRSFLVALLEPNH